VRPSFAILIKSMPRRARIVVPGCAHHVTQRGNRGGVVFLDDEDRFLYMNLLREQSEIRRLLIWVYTLMTNHIHTIVVPESESSLYETFRNTHSVYSQCFNKKYGLNGHLWQARFYSCVLDEAHLWAAVRYVERNPVRAKMVERAESYRWSSARAHVYGAPDPLLDPGLPLLSMVENWSQWLAAEDAPSELAAIRKSTSRDLPLGDEAFIQGLEARFGRPLRERKRGRKPKTNPVDQPSMEFGSE
jgi:putative transposase